MVPQTRQTRPPARIRPGQTVKCGCLTRADQRIRFDDIAAVVFYLKAVSWSIPGYSLEKHRDRLRALYEDASAWPVMTSGHRFLLVASSPAEPPGPLPRRAPGRGVRFRSEQGKFLNPRGFSGFSPSSACTAGRRRRRRAGRPFTFMICCIPVTTMVRPGCWSPLANCTLLARRPSAFQAGHIPSWRESSERYALPTIAVDSGWLLLLLSPLLSAAGPVSEISPAL
jgi:hypothetical protein